MRRHLTWLLLSLPCAVALAQKGLQTPALPDATNKPVTYDYRLVASYPHDQQSSTQGIVFSSGYIFESTGLYGQSSLRKSVLKSGKLINEVFLDKHHFGEGLTLYEDKLYQLTWRSGTAHVYKKNNLDQTATFHYSGEGWGLTHNNREFIVSNGSSSLQFFDLKTFKLIRTLQVTDELGPVMRLNELEFVDGAIYANVLYESRIAVIDPDTGSVTAWIELDRLIELNEQSTTGPDVYPGTLNGIAWDAANKRLLVTGKRWSKIFEIELIKRGS